MLTILTLLSAASSTASTSPMMDISPLERAFAEERELRERALAAASLGNKSPPPLPPHAAAAMASAVAAANAAAAAQAAASASADHNGNKDAHKTTPGTFPFYPASLAAAFNLRPAPPSSLASSLPVSLTGIPTSNPSVQTTAVTSAVHSAALNLSSSKNNISPEFDKISLWNIKPRIYYF